MKEIYHSLKQKPSHTGLMTSQHEVNRLDNIFFKKTLSAFYLDEYGLDWDLFESPKITVSIPSFVNYITRQATNQGITILSLEQAFGEFQLNLKATLMSEETTYLRR